jgi:hypothetical protein
MLPTVRKRSVSCGDESKVRALGGGGFGFFRLMTATGGVEAKVCSSVTCGNVTCGLLAIFQRSRRIHRRDFKIAW